MSNAKIEEFSVSDLLSPLFLTFVDKRIRAQYERVRMVRYSKIMPIYTLAVVFFTLMLEY